MKEGDIIESGFWAGAEVISVYTRAQAIEDGVLVDVSETAREAGFVVPVAVTSAVWSLIEPTELESARCQDREGRLWDVLFMAYWAIKQRLPHIDTGEPTSELPFQLYLKFAARPGVKNGLRRQTLKLHSGPGDDMEHVITIMLPEED